MHWRLVIKTIGLLIFCIGITMLLPLAVCLVYGDACTASLEVAVCVTLAAGLLFYVPCKNTGENAISSRDAIAIVAFGWATVGLFGALPFYLSGEFGPLVDSLFESVSGFTTTGASILTEIESVSKGLLFWRSFIQWLGGMGIIVLSIAILPFIGVGGMQLYKAEVPSPVPDKLKPRIRDTAKILWKVYVLITGIEVVLLIFGGMSFFDAVCHALTTLPTGGFSTKNTSVDYFNSAYIDTVLIIFMLLAGINFSLHYQLLRGKPLAFWKDSECRFFLGMVVVLVFIVSLNIYGNVYETIGESLRYGAFQIASIVTTTGFATADYEQWPALSQIILFLCMIVGASAGSTGGGVKCLRVMLCFKYCYRELIMLIHPHAVKHIKINKESVPEDVIRSVMGFLALYMVIFAVSALLLAGTGVDFLTAIGAVAASIGNIGPGFGMVGPVENYALIPVMGKWLLIGCMLVGRLEIYTIIILLVPEFWRR
jgi:trk system potassium uptake protein TrkH